MGFFDTFLGKTQQGDLDAGYRDSRRDTNRGYDRGEDLLKHGRNRALGDLAYGRNAITDGVRDASGTVSDYTNQAVNTLSPYAQSGAGATDLYNQALGIDGRDAQQDFYSNYEADPFREFNEDRTTNALLRKYNAAGMGNSGASRIAAARANLERGSQDYNAYLDRLRGASAQGGQFASQQANIQAGAGDRIGGYQYGGGQAVANNFGQQADLNRNTGNALAGLAVDRGITNAGNRINYANATAANRSTGLNNLLNLGGTALKAFTAFK